MPVETANAEEREVARGAVVLTIAGFMLIQAAGVPLQLPWQREPDR
jgi:hypothetical protein